MGFTIRKAKYDDLLGMARVHIESFPHFYSTNMGESFLIAFYRCYIDEGIAIVAEQDANIVGLVIGGEKSIRSKFMSQSVRRFLGTLAWKCVTNQAVRVALFNQIKAKLVRGERAEVGQAAIQTTINDAWLQIICASQRVRGSSVALDLLNRFREESENAGYEGMGLCVAKLNERARGFYKKNGFEFVAEDGFNHELRASF